ncbi:hypothetical protein DENSPDRAFT_270332 [Dentipellis sp. KUC8613]|nr:hypothetical protein DENSPDRAFT_270332 [Dentipellis sp. KUC8613]
MGTKDEGWGGGGPGDEGMDQDGGGRAVDARILVPTDIYLVFTKDWSTCYVDDSVVSPGRRNKPCMPRALYEWERLMLAIAIGACELTESNLHWVRPQPAVQAVTRTDEICQCVFRTAPLKQSKVKPRSVLERAIRSFRMSQDSERLLDRK